MTDADATPEGQPAAPEQPEFQLYRAKVKAHSQKSGILFTKQVAALLMTVVGFGLYLALTSSWSWPWESTPASLPVVPLVVDRLQLGMTPDEIEELNELLPKRAANWVGAVPSSGESWRFVGYPADYPKNVILSDTPELRGKLSFENDQLHTLHVLHEGHGTEVDATTVLESFLEAFQERLEAKQLPTLEEVEDDLGAMALRVGRVLDAEAEEHKDLTVYRWSYAFLGGGKVGGLVDLDAYVTPEGKVVRIGY